VEMIQGFRHSNTPNFANRKQRKKKETE